MLPFRAVRALFVAAAGACGVFSLASCTLVDSLDGLTGNDGSADGAASDVRTPVDASAETGVDASLPSDGTTDSPALPVEGSATPDGGTSEDGPSPLFSDDFEGPQALPRAWDGMFTVGGSLALDHTLYVSPDTSLEATSGAIDAGAPGNAVNVTLRKHFPMPEPGQTAVYDFRAYPQQYDILNGADAVIGALQIGDSAGDLYELQLDTHLDVDAGAMAVTFAEYTGLVDGAPRTSAIPRRARWSRVAGTRPGSSSRSRSRRSRRSISMACWRWRRRSTSQSRARRSEISLGLSYVRPNSDPWNVYYDDVSYDVGP